MNYTEVLAETLESWPTRLRWTLMRGAYAVGVILAVALILGALAILGSEVARVLDTVPGQGLV